ncbi:hypothetical protein JDV02_007457 [Purpureocillium takamizusanense]|uniref:Uncharacterized protein n=1 Tax=Purpureocillium takamizusanense TaxID=2060973 RepID=A0A9Q8VE28_9HYPO|nr:uncharacterized protein JDV02_007457 [Purpureocillium takamizusanense]UNI21469.1 hypothetical protein JDV02_007457 [Purpureocillium takamizusanense]
MATATQPLRACPWRVVPRACSRAKGTCAAAAAPPLARSITPTSSAAASSSSPSSASSASSMPAHAQRRFPAWFVRGGTSNGLVIRRDALPAEQRLWPSVLAPAMGAPDPLFARQLDGMGSGLSSTSKVVVLSPPSQRRPGGVHVDYTFVQVGIRDGALDLAGNCGNMSSVVGPAAWDLGFVPEGVAAAAGLVERDDHGDAWASVRMFNTNTAKVIVSRFRVAGRPLAYCPDGDYAMDGVPGTHSLITLGFEDPAGAKTGRALPTGSPTDELRLPDGARVTASLVDVGNPGVFVSTRDPGLGLGLGALAQASALTPAAVEADAQLRDRLEQVRRAGASRMGLDPDTESVPKIVLLFPRAETPPGMDLRCLAMSMGQAHKAMPLTLALCLGASARMPGTLAAGLLAEAGKDVATTAGQADVTLTLGHPSGKLDVGTVMRDGRIESAKLLRTARVLMKGHVYY